MRKLVTIAIMSVLLLAACSKTSETAASTSATTAAEPPGNAPPPVTPVPAATIAYSYTADVELPNDAVAAVFARHRSACENAGALICQLLNASLTNADGAASAKLELRATPAWLAAFRAGLTRDAQAVGGQLAATTTEGEDVGRQLTDTGARLRAATTLRDRLQAMLATRPGKVADLLAIERELARVEGEIDASRSALGDLQARVQMSHMTVRYGPDAATLSRDETVRSAGRTSLVATVTQSASLLVQFLAAALPWAVVLLPLIWGLGRLRRARRARVLARTTSRT